MKRQITLNSLWRKKQKNVKLNEQSTVIPCSNVHRTDEGIVIEDRNVGSDCENVRAVDVIIIKLPKWLILGR